MTTSLSLRLLGATLALTCVVALLAPVHARADLTIIESDGIVAAASPTVNGSVRAIVADGQGGMYIGGDFTTVNGSVRTGLAHIEASGALGTWNPPTPNGTVTHLAVVGGSIYATGEFTAIGGTARAGAAAFSSTGALLAWNPGGDGGPLVTDGTSLYLGGLSVRAVNTAGAMTWTQSAAARALAVSGGVLYIAGSFSSVATGPAASATRSGVAALSTATGYANSWAPTPDASVTAIAVRNGQIHLGGSFTTVNSTTRLRLAAVDASGALAAWNPSVTSSSPTINGLLATANGVVVTGTFDEIGGGRHRAFAVVDSSGSIIEPLVYARSGTTVAAAIAGNLVIGSDSAIPTVMTKPGTPTISNVSASGLRIQVTVSASERNGNQVPHFSITCSGPSGSASANTSGTSSMLTQYVWVPAPGSYTCTALHKSDTASGLADSTASAPSPAVVAVGTASGVATATDVATTTSFERTLTVNGKGSIAISRCRTRANPKSCAFVRTCTATCTHTFTKSEQGTYFILEARPGDGSAVTALGFFGLTGTPKGRSRCQWNTAMTSHNPLACFTRYDRIYQDSDPKWRRFAVTFDSRAAAFASPIAVASFKAARPKVSQLAWTATVKSLAIPYVTRIAATCTSASGRRTSRVVAFKPPTSGRVTVEDVKVGISINGLTAGTTYTCLLAVSGSGFKPANFRSTTGTLGGGSAAGGAGSSTSGGAAAPVRPAIGPIVL